MSMFEREQNVINSKVMEQRDRHLRIQEIQYSLTSLHSTDLENTINTFNKIDQLEEISTEVWQRKSY